MRSIATALAFTALSAAPSRATDLMVGPPGSGAPYQQIQHAVNLAQPGDRVLVLPGWYDESVLIEKAIELVGSGTEASFIRAFSSSTDVTEPPLTVARLPAGTRLRVAGFQLVASSALGVPGCPLLVQDTQGVVELADLVINAYGVPLVEPSTELGVLTLRDVAQVVIHGVRARASDGELVFGLGGQSLEVNGMHGLLLERSAAWINDSSFLASGGGFADGTPFGSQAGDGGHGLFAIDSRVQLARVHARGGKAGGLPIAGAKQGGAGLDARGSAVRVHGGAGSLLEGANAVNADFLGELNFGKAGSAVRLDAASDLALAPDAALLAGAAEGSMPAADLLDAAPGSVSATLAERQPSIDLEPSYAGLGATLRLTYQGEPGSVHLRGTALKTAPALELPGIAGHLLLDLDALQLSAASILPASGELQLASAIPNLSWLSACAVVQQSAQVTGLGISLAPPVVLTVGF